MSTPATSSLRRILHIAMASAYVVAGVVMFIGWSPDGLPDLNRHIIAGALVIYGAYRVHRAIRKTGPLSPDETHDTP